MSERTKNARNVLIIFAIGAGVYFIPGGGRAAETAGAALWTVFAIALGFLGLRLWREHHVALDGLGERHRGLLYGAVALGFFLWAVRSRMWYTLQGQRWGGLGEVLWFALAALAVYSLIAVYRHARAY